MTAELGVSSEIGRLRTVMVHRPGVEIARLTPDNKADLLFDDLLWLERAQQEHDRFAKLMVDRGVEVLYFEDLLSEAIADDAVRDDLLDHAVTPTTCGPRVAEALGAQLRQAPTETVVEVLVGGLLERELVDWGIAHLYEDLVADRFHHVLRPLPNLLFMRDNAAWINNGLSLNVLSTPARERESMYMRTIYRHHARFRDQRFPVWFGADPSDVYPASIEGGDVLVLSPDTVIVGLGQRTAPAAVEMLARRLFADGQVSRVIVVHLPHDRSVMHLDTVFTMVDIDKFNVFPGLLESVDVYTLNPAPGGKISVFHDQSLVGALTAALGRDDLVMIPTGGDAIGRLREQWDDGNNTLALAPGVVVAYERNQETNRRLADGGIEVLELDASELCRGRGGSRCMTQPLLRDPV
ncbi:MAG: arginine deiminase [Acidimicrobiia bacterium]